ncbi:MAG: hypothetical protein Q3972_08830, partial [Corynebacterium sp.]|nr:hypothetical protein [Corynebacterium sp.]
TATYQVRLADNTDAVTTVTVGEIAGLSPAPSASTTPENEGESNGKITGLESDKSYEYSADGGKTWKTVPAGSTEVTGLSTGEYQVRIVDGSGNATSEAATVTVGLIPAAPVVGTTPSVRDQKTGTITGLDGAKSYEYSTDGGVTWIAVTPGSTTIEGLPTGGYQVRVAANGDVPASKAATANVGVIDPAPSASTTPENEGESNGKITGLDSDKSYQYSTDGGVNWINVPAGSPEVTGLPTGEYQVRIVDASGNATSLVAKVTVGVVNKPAAPSLQSTPSGSNNNEGTITGLDPNVEYEYRKVGESEFTDVPAGSSSITGLTAGSYEVRVKAKGETRASQIATVTVASSTVTPAAPDNVGTASVTKRGVTNGRIIGLNPLSLYEYRMAGTDNWISVPAGSTEIDGLAAGSYELRYAASTTTGAAASESVELTVGEAANGSSLSSGSSYAPWMGIAGAAGLGFFILAAASLCTDQFGIVSYQIPTRRPESINLNKRDNDNLAPHLRRCDEGAVNFVVPASPLCTDDAGIASYKLAGHRPESLGLSEKDNREVAPFLRPCDKNETDIAGPGGTFCTDANGIASRQHPGARPESLGLTDLENRNIAPRLGRCSE